MSTLREEGRVIDGTDELPASASGRALVRDTGHILWTATAEGLADAEQWCLYTGQNAAEARGQDWLEAVHPDDRERIAQGWARAVAKRGQFDAEVRIRRFDGAYRTLLLRATPVSDPGGSDWTWVGFGADITERAEAEEVLRRSAERLRSVVARAPVVLFAVDRDGIFTLSEGQELELLGLQPGQHVGQSYFALYSHLPDSVAAMRRALDGVAATTIDEYRGYVFETRWIPMAGSQGVVTGVIGVSANITEQRRLERRTSEALEALLAIAEVLVRGGDEDTSLPVETRGAGEIEAVARRLVELTRRVLGCARASITLHDAATGVARPLAIVGVRPEEEQAWRSGQPGASVREHLDAAQLARLFSEDVLVFDAAEMPNRPLPFGIRTLLLAALRVGGHVVGVLTLDHGHVAHAYTEGEVALARAVARLSALVIERERLVSEREEARAAEAALREANRRMDEFLGIASHELRTPLTGLRGSLQVMQRRLERAAAEGNSDEPATDLARLWPFLDRAVQQSRVLGNLVDDLLDLSRIQAGQLQLRRAICDLSAVVVQAVDEQRVINPTRVIEIQGTAAPVYVSADADRLAQVVVNYLTNALKYSEEEQPVSVGMEVEDAEARVWVRDEGPGIPEADQERIWDRFYRVEGTGHRTGSSVGLGLGLYISRTIIERHGGRVAVASTPGAGATFWLTLPITDTSDAARGRAP